MSDNAPVLIVGGGLNGLTMAALLADLRVPCVVIERHRSTSIQYKFAGISPRSMEIFRSLGLEAEIRRHRTGDQQGGGIARGETLSHPQIEWSGAAWPDASPFSPTQPCTCDQHVLEPILRRHAEHLGADVRFGTEFQSLEQTAQGVRIRIADLQSGREETIAGSYLIAADGADGTIRERLGIGRSGPGVLQRWMNIIFDTDLPDTLGGRRFTSCFVTSINATFTPRQGGRWLLALQYSPDAGEHPEDFDAARCRELVTKGAGRSDIRVDLVEARSWQAAASIADSLQTDRCFLIGDAAHLMPPTGAFGGNSGIHDAHNLAWKLALVLRGVADRTLLGTYSRERRPVIEATLAQALARLQKWFRDLGGRLPPPVDIVPEYDVVFGQRYFDGALLREKNHEETVFADHRTLSAVPGTRAPHRSIVFRGEDCSTLDLFHREFVLLSGSAAQWCDAVAKIAACGIAMKCCQFGAGALGANDAWPDSFGVGADGAVLVRPDGFVAWRSHSLPSDPYAAMSAVMKRLGLQGS